MMDDYRCRTANGYWATVSLFEWCRNEFTHLGYIEVPYSELGRHRIVPWAWHDDGRSIDLDDRAFDLIDFPHASAPKPHFWLGAEAEKVRP